MKHSIKFLAFIIILPAFLQAQMEQLDVEGGISTDSLFIRNLPAFRAESTDTFDIVQFATDNIILYNDSWVDAPVTDHMSVFDNNNDFDSSTGIFLVPREGIYWFQCDLTAKSHHLFDDRIQVYISVNGNVTDNCLNGNFTFISGGNTGSWSGEFATLKRSVNGILKLNKGDEVSMQFMYNNGPNSPGFQIFYLDKNTVFTGYLITDLD